jgi:hypothetical protein
LLHQESDIRRQVGGNTNGAGVGAVRCTERIVHEDVAIRGESLGECRIVALLTSMEANILKEEQLARSQATHGIVGTNTKCITGRRHVHTNKLRESLSCGSQAKAIDNATIWSAKVRHDHDRCTAIKERLDGWDGGADARIVNDLSIGERHIEVDAQQHALALHVQLTDRALP